MTRTTTRTTRSTNTTTAKTLDFSTITVPDQFLNPARVVGEYRFRVVDYGGRISFRVEEDLGTGRFTCFASHQCNDPHYRVTTFTGDTAEAALSDALSHYADFNGAPQTRQMPSPDRFTPIPEYALGGFDLDAVKSWLRRGHMNG